MILSPFLYLKDCCVCSGVMLRFVTSYWGSRVSVMLGGVLASAGLALCMLVQELYQLYLAFGLLVGESQASAFYIEVLFSSHLNSVSFRALTIGL